MFKLFLVTALLAIVISRKVHQVSDDPYPYAIQHSLINLGDPTWEIAQTEFSSGLIVYFYETYCLPCRQFWSELTTATSAIAKELPKGTNPPMAKVECHDEVRLCDAKGVTNFPTILFYIKGKTPQEYTGARTAAAFEKWARKVLIGEYHKVSTKEELFSRYSTAILLKDEFDYVDKAYEDLIDTVEIAMAAGDLKSVVKGDGVILTQGGLSERLPSSAEGIVSRIKKILYADKEAVPTFGQTQSKELQGPENKDYVLFFKTKSYSYASSEAKVFDKLAQGKWHSSEFEFAYVNVDGDTLGGTMGKQFGVKSDDAVTVGIASKNGKNIKKYRLAQNQAVTEDSVNKLLKDFLENKGKSNVKEPNRYMMSAPVPAHKLKSGDVVELVGSNFKEIVNNATMNVFVEFYFPWCEWCMKLEPTWKSLAYRYRDIKDLMFARIDVSQNDIEYALTEFPVLFFYEAKPDAEPIEYLSDKTMRNLKTFVESHVSAAKETAIDL